ncbi:PilZ domain-containing protein [uncultured Caulobacter sp.]|uniref:PilZ domain-containing protein n=1 Tax=uncultured Caulobacter sp. TaxID=158749 RepID=UPI002625B94A|nr:PilZ domain-containing protein [uncultured Caulobacter sp.]
MAKYASDVEQDRRAAVRIQTQRSGKILCGAFAWDCVIRDLSSVGARVQMLSSNAPPARAQLVDLVAGLAHDVTVAWQRDREFGLRIVRTYDLRGLTPAAAGAAKRIWRAARADAPAG